MLLVLLLLSFRASESLGLGNESLPKLTLRYLPLVFGMAGNTFLSR